MPVTIDGHLLERNLQVALREIVGAAAWKGEQVKVDVEGFRKFKWDMGFEIENTITYVEFDGPQHYQDPKVIRRDRDKDKILKQLGVVSVRIPYWVQLTTETLEHYFGLHETIIQNFAHGFITTTEFPASFCEMGIDRFATELDSLPNTVKTSVMRCP